MFSIVHVLAFALSVSATPFQLEENQLSHLSCQNQTECPLWFYHDSTMCDCQCVPYHQVTCKGNNAFIDLHHIITYNKNKRLVSVINAESYRLAHGGYNMTDHGYILLPRNISTLNGYMCGPLNRKGFLCGECSDGFGPSMILTASTIKCYNCSEPWHGMTLYLFLEFVPITAFYFFVLTFHISVTSAPMTCFIMYSQLIIIAFFFFMG